jgi:hypothetical protein
LKNRFGNGLSRSTYNEADRMDLTWTTGNKRKPNYDPATKKRSLFSGSPAISGFNRPTYTFAWGSGVFEKATTRYVGISGALIRKMVFSLALLAGVAVAAFLVGDRLPSGFLS